MDTAAAGRRIWWTIGHLAALAVGWTLILGVLACGVWFLWMLIKRIVLRK